VAAGDRPGATGAAAPADSDLDSDHWKQAAEPQYRPGLAGATRAGRLVAALGPAIAWPWPAIIRVIVPVTSQ
jgi:hypothetical protein